jgi:WD40 repeat protein
VYSVAFHPDGSRLASASVDKTIRIWNVADGKELHKLDGHPDDIYAVAYSPDSRRLASIGNAGNLFVWDSNEGRVLFHQRLGPRTYAYGLAWSPDGSQLAVAASDGKVHLFKLP